MSFFKNLFNVIFLPFKIIYHVLITILLLVYRPIKNYLSGSFIIQVSVIASIITIALFFTDNIKPLIKHTESNTEQTERDDAAYLDKGNLITGRFWERPNLSYEIPKDTNDTNYINFEGGDKIDAELASKNEIIDIIELITFITDIGELWPSDLAGLKIHWNDNLKEDLFRKHYFSDPDASKYNLDYSPIFADYKDGYFYGYHNNKRDIAYRIGNGLEPAKWYIRAYTCDYSSSCSHSYNNFLIVPPVIKTGIISLFNQNVFISILRKNNIKFDILYSYDYSSSEIPSENSLYSYFSSQLLVKINYSIIEVLEIAGGNAGWHEGRIRIWPLDEFSNSPEYTNKLILQFIGKNIEKIMDMNG
ncbi:MAG: hypothetical protein AB7E96_10110 [Deferribacterales bacterium]